MNKQTVFAASVVSLVVLATGACTNSEHAASPGALPTPIATTPAPTTTAPTITATSPAVVREVLDNDPTPPGAPGSALSLVRYTIPAGAKLVPHVHPGVQMASIDSGTLTYTVISGTAQVRRAGTTTGAPTTGPTTIELRKGDAVTETGNMVHFGENKTREPVVILASLLTERGHELAEPVATGAPR